MRDRGWKHRLHVLVDGGREKLVLPVSAQRIHDVVDRRLEAHVQTAVHFVQNQAAHVRAVEARRLLQVLKETPGRGDENVHAEDAALLLLEVLAADHQTR